METSSTPLDLMHAKRKVFNDLCFKHSPKLILDNALYRNERDFMGKQWKVRLGWFDTNAASRVMHTTLMKLAPHAKRPSFITLRLGRWDMALKGHACIRHNAANLHHVPITVFNEVFDELCRLSDDGNSIVYYEASSQQPSFGKTKKDMRVLIPPGSGSAMLIEADMLAPDFAPQPYAALPF